MRQAPNLSGERNAPLLLLMAVTMVGTMAMHIFVPALPSAGADLGASPTTMQLTITLYLIGLALGQLVYGPLSDRFGRRPVILAGLSLYLLGLLLAIPATGIWALIAARVLQSLGACGALVLGRAMVRDTTTGDDLVRRIALLTVAMTLTPAAAPAIGGLINTWFGWRAIFIVMAFAVGALMVLAIWRLRETNHLLTPLPDIASVARIYARLLAQPVYRNYVIAGACCTTSSYAFLSSAPFLFVDVLKRPESEVGLICVLVLGGLVLGAFLAQMGARRLKPRTAAKIGCGACIVGATLLLLVDLCNLLSVPTVVAPMFLFAAGAGFVSPNTVSGLMNAAPEAIGSASSLYGFCQMSAGVVFTLVVAFWHLPSALPLAVTLLGAAVTARIALSRV